MKTLSLYQQLRQDIRQGIWPAGQLMNQQKLSDYYQVSRIPVRDALQQLKAEGLLVMAGKASLKVPELSAAEAEELYQIRLALEPLALERALPALSFHQLGRAEDLLQQIEQQQHLSAADRGAMNWQFHALLYQAGDQSPQLLQLLHRVHQQVERYLGFQELALNYTDTSATEHWQLLQLLRDGQSQQALTLLHSHIAQAGQLLVQHLTALEQTTTSQQSSPAD
ncbi:GntR family transcriptional regulator [Rheinheimera sp.]|uniref:GntR family transcriptional regulator n=1 Tax=Rheinheimera sp. TaxID=1869214 RepID=UPI00307F80CD